MSTVKTWVIYCVILIGGFDGTYGALSTREKQIIKDNMTPIIAECGELHPITDEEITEIFDKGTYTALTLCFSACIARKIEFVHGNGQINGNKIYQLASKYLPEKDQIYATRLLNSCGRLNENETDDGEKYCERIKPIFDCALPILKTLYGTP